MRTLVRAGAGGGLVTLSRVYNEQATKMGQLTARLLNQGFPLDATMDVLGYGPLSSHRYAAVGDHHLQICQTTDTRPTLALLEKIGEDLRCRFCEYTTSGGGELGSVSRPHVSNSPLWSVAGGKTDDYRTNQSDLRDGLDLGPIPLLAEQEIHRESTSVADSLRN